MSDNQVSEDLYDDMRAELTGTIWRLEAERMELIAALRAIADQEQHDGQTETHMHDMADLARTALSRIGSGI